LPLTDRIWVLKYGDEPSERIRDEFVYEKQHPNELLRLFNMVDTPGTNSIVRKHQQITESFLPKADLTVFVTSIDRPFSESEHQFLNLISERWRKQVLFVLTKIDTHDPGDVPKVVEYIRENCRKFYDFEPLVFPISAKRARTDRQGSGMVELEEYLASRLAEEERVRLKLTSPVKSGLALLDDLGNAFSTRRELLEGDFQSLTDLDAQVAQSTRELKERYNVYVVRFYDLLREFERRGKNFFETTLRVKNFGLLRNPEAFQRKFETEVVGELKEKIQANMHAATDWLMKEQISLFQRSLHYLTEHLAVDKYRDRVAAPSPKEQSFDYHRDTLVASMQESFQREIERFDIEGECNRVMETAYRGVLQQLGVQAGAVGVGALLVAILTGAMLDMTGVLAAGVLFATGFVILPRKKRRVIQQFSLKIDALIREFKQVLAREFDREIDEAGERLRAGYGPYLTFYRAETGFVSESEERHRQIRMRLLEILDSAHALFAEKHGGAEETPPR
jgi:GTP-binding protein EngB required for normal cell division